MPPLRKHRMPGHPPGGKPSAIWTWSRTLLLLLCWLWAGTLAALDPRQDLHQFDLRTFSLSEGLPSSRVQAILQTRDGALWVGTIEGLARFDGVRFVAVPLPGARPGSRLGVFHLAEDREGRLWVATHEGVRRLDQGQMMSLTRQEGLPGNLVSHLLPDPDGSMWIGTSEGLCRIQGKSIQSFGLSDGLSDLNIQALARCPSGGIWVGTRRGLDRWTGSRFLPWRAPGLPTVITALHGDRSEGLWVGTEQGLFRIRNDRSEVHIGRGPFGDPITLLHQDRHGTLWAACKNTGVYRISGASVSPLLSRGKPVFFCVAMAEDHEGSLWLGTLDFGMHQLTSREVNVLDGRRGLPASTLRNVLEDRRGVLWMGSVGEGLVAMEAGRWRTYGKAEGLGSLSVWCLLEDPEGTLWIGTYGGGVYRMRGGRFTPFGADQGLGREIIRALLRDRRGRLWVGTEGGGLHVFEGDRRVQTYTRRNGLADDQVYALAEDREGAVWVGCFNGTLQRITGEGIRSYGVAEGLPAAIIFTLHARPNGSLWIAVARHGLLRLKDGRFQHLTVQQGLPGNTCFGIIEPEPGSMWVVTTDGTAEFAAADLEAAASSGGTVLPRKVFTRLDGVTPPPGPSSPCGWHGRDGRLWVPITQGVAALRTGPKGPSDPIPPMAILRLAVDGRDWVQPQEVQVPPGPGDVEVDFTAFSFKEPGKVRFRYRLEGYQQNWVEAGSRRTAYFTRLPAGRYTFRVIACNADGIWNEVGATLAFRIKTPWYRTPWASAGFLMAGAAALGSLVTWRLRLVQQQKAELEQKVAERTLELAAANEALQRQSLTDPLTGLGNRRSLDAGIGGIMRRYLRSQGDPQGGRNRGLAFLLLDLDHFKTVNDTLGHAAGDRVLRQLAGVIQGEVRETDPIVRWGGEEFVVVATDTEQVEVPTLVERIRQSVASTPFEVGLGEPITKTVSIGFVALPLHPDCPDWPGWEQALSLADQCLYLAKATGRNRWVGIVPGPNPAQDPPSTTLDLQRLEEQGWVTRLEGPLSGPLA